MKVVIPGGSGHLGRTLQASLGAAGHRVVLLSRGGEGPDVVAWDGKTLGPWVDELDGADVVINLAGRSVNCRYDKHNLSEMLMSRIDSTRIVGEAIAAAKRPPAVWLQSSTATIYAHTLGEGHTEQRGVIGGREPDVPRYWDYSVHIAVAWERELADAATPHTRKVALRTAMVMGPEQGGTFDILLTLARFGLGGAVAGGRQFMSWIHADDFVRALLFVVERDSLDGPINVVAPEPLPQAELMAVLREASGAVVGLPATRWMVELGAWAMRSDPELLLKSRRVLPGRLQDAGFAFEFSRWPAAAADLVRRVRARP